MAEDDLPAPSRLTKGERTELLQLIRKRERVMVAAASERATVMLAEFEAQLAAIYDFDQDEVWRAAMAEADEAVAVAQAKVRARCAELGIPREFAPTISTPGWYDRGQNAVEKRRFELRRAAKARIAASEKEAITRIERLSLEAQTDLLSRGLGTEAAQDFLAGLASVDVLMPPLDARAIKSDLEALAPSQRAMLSYSSPEVRT